MFTVFSGTCALTRSRFCVVVLVLRHCFEGFMCVRVQTKKNKKYSYEGVTAVYYSLPEQIN